MVPMTWIEHVASPLPRECSTTELHGHSKNTGAGEGNRTLVISLEGFCSTIELHPLNDEPPYGNPPDHLTRTAPAKTVTAKNLWWRGLDSNQRRRKPTDLQSAPFSHSGTSPRGIRNYRDKSSDRQALSLTISVCPGGRHAPKRKTGAYC